MKKSNKLANKIFDLFYNQDLLKKIATFQKTLKPKELTVQKLNHLEYK